MDLAFVGGGHVHMKDLNRVLLVTLPDATIGPVSSGRKLDYCETFSRTERATLGMTSETAFKEHPCWFSAPPPFHIGEVIS